MSDTENMLQIWIDNKDVSLQDVFDWIERLRATELAHASTITELSLKVGDLQTQLAAKDAVVEAARVTHENYRRRFGPKAAEVDMGKLWSALDALRALDQPCPTCGGSGEVELPFLHPSAPGTADCPDCGDE